MKREDYPCGVKHLTSGTHFSVISIAEDGTVELQQTYNKPSVDNNGIVTFPKAIQFVSESYFRAEFRPLTFDEFLDEFPQDNFIRKYDSTLSRKPETTQKSTKVCRIEIMVVDRNEVREEAIKDIINYAISPYSSFLPAITINVSSEAKTPSKGTG